MLEGLAEGRGLPASGYTTPKFSRFILRKGLTRMRPYSILLLSTTQSTPEANMANTSSDRRGVTTGEFYARLNSKLDGPMLDIALQVCKLENEIHETDDTSKVPALHGLRQQLSGLTAASRNVHYKAAAEIIAK